MRELFRALPSVDACLNAMDGVLRKLEAPHTRSRELINRFLDSCREDIRSGAVSSPAELEADRLMPRLEAFLRKGLRPSLRRVLNATGVVIHTNLGRSVLARRAIEAAVTAASGYCNLEYNLETGSRGSRHTLVDGLIRTLTGAEAALVVNNNAAAVLLVLDTLCKGGEVVVSRGQLVEIGGSFRIPDVMARSGALLREVGTTNRTHLSDYARAINENTRALMRVHTSNYRVIGFHTEVSLEDMVRLAHDHDLPLLEDLGSGSLIDFSPWGLPGEPTARQVISSGADIVTFSGDKVLGGPQAGIIAGRAELIDAMRSNQLLRALRCDKMTLAALEATLRLYLDQEKALAEVPTLRRMTMPPAELKRRAEKLRKTLRRAIDRDYAEFSLVPGYSRVGGGSFPECDLPTTLVRVLPLACTVETLRSRLLHTDPPLVARVESGTLLLDPRTLEDHEFPALAQVLAEVLTYRIQPEAKDM